MNKEDIKLYNLISKGLSRKHKEHLFASDTRQNNLMYYQALNDYDNFKEIFTEEQFKEIIRYKKRRSQKRYRCNQKVKPILPFEIINRIDFEEPVVIVRDNIDTNRLVFGTCTFNDKQFFYKNGKMKKERTRTLKVNEWIRKHFTYAVVNIDYGETTEREHHHFIGYLNKDEELEHKKYKFFELKNKDYNLGFEPTLEKIIINDEDIKLKKVSNYLLKINNHSNKPSSINRRIRVLY